MKFKSCLIKELILWNVEFKDFDLLNASFLIKLLPHNKDTLSR